MPTRTVSSTFLLVLLTSALFISIYSVTVPTPVHATIYNSHITGPIQLSETSGPPGTWVTVTATLNNTVPSGTTCKFTANYLYFISTEYAGTCVVYGTSIIGTFRVFAPDEISSSTPLPGLVYRVGVNLLTLPTPYTYINNQTATFAVTPKIGFSSTCSGGPGVGCPAQTWPNSMTVMLTQTVYVHGWGFNASSTGCSYKASPALFSSIATGSICSINSGEMAGQFNVVGGLGTTQTITVNGTATANPHPSYYASGTLTIVNGPAIQVNPRSGPIGTTVTVTGVGFSASDTSCVLSFLNLTFGQLFAANPSCTLATVGTWKQPTVTFNVAPTAGVGKNYTLQVLGLPTNDYAYSYFKVNASAIISLVPNTGPPGTLVAVTNTTKFSAMDAGLCTITTPSSTVLISSYICIIKPDGGLNSLTSLFVSYSTAGGAYVVRVTGSSGDYAEATFVATTKPTVTLTPHCGSGGGGPCGTGGDTITVTGLKFNLGSTTCSIYTNGTTTAIPPNAVQSYSCSISSGTVTGSFVIRGPDIPAGPYNVTVAGNTPDDKGYALLRVNPKLTLSPGGSSSNPAYVGQQVYASGYNYAAADVDKKIEFTSFPGDAINKTKPTTLRYFGYVDSHYALTSNSSFYVAANPSQNTYTISGNFTAGNYVVPQATLYIVPRIVLLSPDHGARGSWVNVTGTGFSLNDTSCSVTGIPVSGTCGGSAGPCSCTVSGGNLKFKFQVNSTAPLGLYSLTVTGLSYGDRVLTSFTVTPSITLNPSSAHPGTSVTVFGSGFSVADTSCTITSSPSGLISNPTCSVAGGNMAGSFTVASGATGAYTVIVTGSSFDSASAPFNRATPTLTLSPPTGLPGTAVTASGGNYQGTTCLLTAVPSNLFISQACAIIAGNLTASFTVASGASGSYTVTVQTNAGAGDSASIIFPIGGTTTTATTSTAVSTSTTFTTATTTPTTTATTTVQTTSSVVSTTTSISTAITTGPWTLPKPCIIATVTFGSEVSSAVQFLRNFRDGLVLSTKAGSAFMEVFNAWYYSFSPSVAGFIAGNDPLRAPIRVLLYPLLGILGVSSLAYSLLSGVPEFAIVVAGLAASSLIGLVYLTLPAMFGVRALLKRRRVRLASLAKGSLALLTVALALLAIGELAGSFLLLAIGGSAIVLTCLVAAPTLFALAMLHRNPE